MGVSKLETFLRENCPKAYYEVNIRSLAEKYRQECKCDPVIVVDGSLCFRVPQEGLDYICGGEYKKYAEKLKNFIKSFDAINIELVVFFDGPIQNEKREVWIKRRLQAVERSHDFFNALARGMTVPELARVSRKINILPVGMYDTMCTVAKDLCKEVHYSLHECDEDIANYAGKNKCFAILSDDTDFLIHQKGAKYLLSPKHLKLDRMTTKCLDQMELARHLGLQIKDLPMFASLMGNDVISVLDLRDFHNKLTGGYYGISVLAKKVAEYVGRHAREDYSTPYLRAQSVEIFGGDHRAEDLKRSILSYSTIFDEDVGPATSTSRNWDKIMSIAHEDFVDARTIPFLYEILTKTTFSLGTVLEDFRKGVVPSAAALRRMRQRMYGVALQECPQRQQTLDFCVHEWCVEGANSLADSRKVPIIIPPGNSPKLLKLWLDPSSEMKREKFKILSWICSEQHLYASDIDLSTFPHQLVAAICILSYLHHDVGILSDLEVRIFASVVVDVQAMNSNDLSRIFVQKVDARGVQLATLFTRGISHVILANSICGLPIPPVWTRHYQLFDGKLFQKSYMEGKVGIVTPQQDCPEAYYDVNIKGLAENYRQEYKCDPVIVVDGSMCFRKPYHGLDFVCGGQYKEYVERLKNFVKSFHAANIKLAVFFDGSIQDAKRTVWVERRLQDVEKSHNMLDNLAKGMTVQNLGKKWRKEYILPVGVFDTMCTLAKDLCEEHLKLDSMTTKRLDQMELARHLGLQIKDLPMFASLMGNDVISVLDLRDFHNKLTGGYYGISVLAKKVAEYVGRHAREDYSIPYLRAQSVEIFGGDHRAEDLNRSILSYSTIFDENVGPAISTSRNWNEIMSIAHKDFVDATTIPFLYNILSKFTFSIGAALENCRNFLPSAAALRRMRQRMYGVALQDCPTQDFCVREWCVWGKYSLVDGLKVPIIIPPENSPKLLKLWLDPSSEMKREKFKLLSWICSEKHLHALDTDLSTFPHQLVAAICILSYLHHDVCILSELEVRIFASVVVDVQAMNSNDLSRIFVQKVDVQGVQLATLFTRAITHVILANSICGLPISSEWTRHYQLFDGKLFQKSYMEGKVGKVAPQKGNYCHFQQICQAVLNNEASQ
ncbi:Constitutive coactivator of peroxisome proliferator-activated receptor gamma [Frankliniella fusca]|uniref:Constitutive coactivator of peroxisome proliferator-activated receptor gamma n=1 Tax=Frankliniella fusca TaxID=407009 RepID=A0AAE1HF85_9NEOP|nr:Constitutive coactivator of peroxisome proliferator-activated receptor gamma [Frankliniella fusca]